MVVPLVLVACGPAGAGRGASFLPDAGTNQATTGPTIDGVWTDTYVAGESEEIAVPNVALSQNLVVINAVLPAFDYDVQTATAGTGGSFRLPDVPTGADYLLQLVGPSSWPASFPTSSRQLAIGNRYLGRPDQAQAAAPTIVTLDASGLLSWSAADETEIFSAEANAIIYAAEATSGATGTPVAGDTTLKVSFDWSQAAGNNDLINLSSTTFAPTHDTTWVTQLVGGTVGGASYAAVAAAFSTHDFAQVDGVPATLSGALAVAGAAGVFAGTWQRTAYAAMAPDMGPFVFQNAGLFLDIMPGALAATNPTSPQGLPDLVTFAPSAGASELSFNIPFLNPFPTAWPPFVGTQATFCRAIDAGAGTTPEALCANNTSAQFLTAAANPGYAPLLGPPRGVQLNGRDASVDQAAAPGDWTVSWSAPSIGTPTRYTVSLVSANDAGGDTTFATVTSLTSTATSVLLPRVEYGGASAILILVEADLGGAYSPTNPFAGVNGFPNAAAQVFSGVLTPM